LPAFSGVADSGTATARSITSFEQGEARMGSNVLVFGFFGLVALILWFVLPGMLWPDESVPMAGPPAVKLANNAVASAPAPRAAPQSAAPEQAVAAVGFRGGVTEVPPRRPTDVTGAFARRVVKK
jgi:hypothetical protein